jgi:uncharacterized protein (DUF1501 family)
MNRRDFLKYASLVFLSSLMPFGIKGWAAGISGMTKLMNTNRKKLVVIFQRGAVDGLNLVIPYQENAYYDARPTIAIPPPGGSSGALVLTEHFSLHPSLGAIHDLWKNKNLAFVHACGMPGASRSHFETQSMIEAGVKSTNTRNGWMNRLLETLAGIQEGAKGISVGSTIPLILQGKVPVSNLAVNTTPIATDLPEIADHFNDLYVNDQEFRYIYMEALKSRKEMLKIFKAEHEEANQGAANPTSLQFTCQLLAILMARDPTMQVAFLDVGGWDTHTNQGSIKGTLADHLTKLSGALMTLVKGLKEIYQDTLIIVLSEFGRTLKENDNRGTDHGYGNVMWALGGGVDGGKIYGTWPGLSQDSLYQQRDLAITTDIRHALSNLLKPHFNLTDQNLNYIFPSI